MSKERKLVYLDEVLKIINENSEDEFDIVDCPSDEVERIYTGTFCETTSVLQFINKLDTVTLPQDEFKVGEMRFYICTSRIDNKPFIRWAERLEMTKEDKEYYTGKNIIKIMKDNELGCFVENDGFYNTRQEAKQALLGLKGGDRA